MAAFSLVRWRAWAVCCLRYRAVIQGPSCIWQGVRWLCTGVGGLADGGCGVRLGAAGAGRAGSWECCAAQVRRRSPARRDPVPGRVTVRGGRWPRQRPGREGGCEVVSSQAGAAGEHL